MVLYQMDWVLVAFIQLLLRLMKLMGSEVINNINNNLIALKLQDLDVKLANSNSPNQVSVLLQIPMYVTITAGEVLFSITGLEFAYSQVYYIHVYNIITCIYTSVLLTLSQLLAVDILQWNPGSLY